MLCWRRQSKPLKLVWWMIDDVAAGSGLEGRRLANTLNTTRRSLRWTRCLLSPLGKPVHSPCCILAAHGSCGPGWRFWRGITRRRYCGASSCAPIGGVLISIFSPRFDAERRPAGRCRYQATFGPAWGTRTPGGPLGCGRPFVWNRRAQTVGKMAFDCCRFRLFSPPNQYCSWCLSGGETGG